MNSAILSRYGLKIEFSAPSPAPAESVTESQTTNTTEGPDTATQASDEVAGQFKRLNGFYLNPKLA